MSEDSAIWLPVATALKLNQAEFAQRVIAALPLIVRRDLDQASAERIVQLLHAMQADARALPDDEQLVYIRHADAVSGPLPQSALADFIAPGQTYQLRGDSAWLTWPAPAGGEPAPIDADELQPAAASTAFADETVEDPVEAPHETVPAPDEGHETTIDIPADEPADTGFAAADSEPPRVTPPSLPEPSSTPVQTSGPGVEASAEAAASTAADEPVDDELINPPDETTSVVHHAETDAWPVTEAADVAPPPRSRGTRLILLLVLAGLAYWAYNHWNADTSGHQTPSAATTSQASTSGIAGKSVATARSTPAAAKPAAATSTAPATSAPLPATGATPAPATSTPASAASTPVPAASASGAAASTPAPATSGTAPAASSSVAQATHDLPVPAVISPAAAASAAKPAASH
ncbi:MAG TPA: hypothetical protein VN043_12960 [Rhodanobacter sp.]|nr:hypothetical protein [Rhodanobacter sp.]